jgi:dTDP-4-dehydrorhamnose reductase
VSKKLLITGASGFLGRYLCDQGLRQGFDVHAVGHNREVSSFRPFSSGPLADSLAVQQGGETSALRRSTIKTYSVNLCNPLAVSQLFCQVKPDAVIHAAAMAHPAVCEQNAEGSYQANVLATRYVAKWAAKQQAHLVFVSSEQVFSGTALVYRASDAPNPVNVYGRHKAQAEQCVHALHPQAVIARLPLLYSFDTADSGFAQAMIEAFRQGKVVQAFTDEVRPPAHVEDVAKALIKLLALNKSVVFKAIVHLGGPEPLTRYEMALQLAQRCAINQSVPSASLTSLITPLLQSALTTGGARPARLWLESTAAWAQLGIQPRTWQQSIAVLNQPDNKIKNSLPVSPLQ